MENRQGEGKNSVGNVEAKELISMTHGHELWGGNEGGSGWRREGGKVQRISSINDRWKIDRGRIRIV